MRSYRGDFTHYYMLPSPVNSFTDVGYTANMWTFQTALDRFFTDSDLRSTRIRRTYHSEGSTAAIEYSLASKTGLTGLTTTSYPSLGTFTVAGAGYTDKFSSDAYGVAGFGPEVGDPDTSGDTTARMKGGTDLSIIDYESGFTGGRELYSVWDAAYGGTGGSSLGVLGDLYQFFPGWVRESNDMSMIDGVNYITSMVNTGIYYQVPPLSPYGFIDETRPFALSVKNEFHELHSTYANYPGGDYGSASMAGGYPGFSVINPCKNCSTIGRAINGWHRMSEFFKGQFGEGVYNPFNVLSPDDYYVGDEPGLSDARTWDSETLAGLSLALAAGTIDLAAYATLIDNLELTQNTYGTAAFTGLYVYESWYGILTSHSAVAESYRDDLFGLLFFHPAGHCGVVTYEGKTISYGGFPDQNLDEPVVSPYAEADYRPDYGYLRADHIAENVYVPNWPIVYPSNSSLSGEVESDVLGGAGDIVVGASNSCNYHTTVDGDTVPDGYGNAGFVVVGDLMRRFGMFDSRADNAYYLRIGSLDWMRGFMRNKAWIVQNSLDVWNGALEQQVKQQTTKKLDLDLLHPVGLERGTESYADAATPTTAPSTMGGSDSGGGSSGGSGGGSYGGGY